MKIPMLGIVMLGVCVAHGVGQTVSQGEATTTAFHSPMVVDTVFAPAVDKSLWICTDSNGASHETQAHNNCRAGAGWFTVADYRALAKFTCDGLSLTALIVRVKQRGDKAEIEIRPTVTNPMGHDKHVTIVFQVLAATEELAKTESRMKVEEHKNEDDDNPRVILRTTALTANPAPTLRLTMSTVDR